MSSNKSKARTAKPSPKTVRPEVMEARRQASRQYAERVAAARIPPVPPAWFAPDLTPDARARCWAIAVGSPSRGVPERVIDAARAVSTAALVVAGCPDASEKQRGELFSAIARMELAFLECGLTSPR